MAQFYVIYIYIYDFNIFSELFDKLYLKSKEILFEILLQYKEHFKNSIKKDDSFYNEFIEYATNKDFKLFNGRALFYLNEIYMFLKIIQKNKEKIMLMKIFRPIQIKAINFGKKNNKKIFELIENIIAYSNEKINIFYKFILRIIIK